MLNDKLKEVITDVLTEECSKEGSGMFHTEIYADYRDEFSDETVRKICRSEAPRETFDEKIFESYENAEMEYENDLLEKIREQEEIAAALESGELDDDELTDYVREHHYVKLPYDHYLNQDLSVNIIVDAGDGNSDFTINQPFASWDGRNDKIIDDNSAILWLARQQGYKKSELTKALHDRKCGQSKFLKSMLQEVENTSTHMNALTFLVEMTFMEWFKLHEAIKQEDQHHPKRSKGRGFVMLDKATTCGLYDPWGGAGSVLEIQLERDVRLPIRFIDSAWPDGARGYSVTEIYGLCSSAWTDDAIKEIHGMKRAA